MNPSYSLRFTSVVTHPPSRVAGCFGWGQKWSKNPHWGKISHFCFFPYPWRTYGTGICTLYILIHLPQKINHSPCGFSWMSWSKSIMVLIMFSNHIQVVVKGRSLWKLPDLLLLEVFDWFDVSYSIRYRNWKIDATAVQLLHVLL